MYSLVRSDPAIDECLNQAIEAEHEGSRWPGMSYEQGVRAAIEWLTDYQAHNPMED